MTNKFGEISNFSYIETILNDNNPKTNTYGCYQCPQTRRVFRPLKQRIPSSISRMAHFPRSQVLSMSLLVGQSSRSRQGHRRAPSYLEWIQRKTGPSHFFWIFKMRLGSSISGGVQLIRVSTSTRYINAATKEVQPSVRCNSKAHPKTSRGSCCKRHPQALSRIKAPEVT